MYSIDIIIDFGSTNISIYKKDAGLILKEPSIVIMHNENGEQELLASGNEAIKIMGKSPNTHTVYPIREGGVVQEKACILMLKNYINRIRPGKFFTPIINAVVLVSSGLINVEKRNIEEVCLKAGVSSAIIIESPTATHMMTDKQHSFIVDIGGHKTEIAIVDSTGIITGCTINIGGDSINQVIIDYLCDKHKMRIPHHFVERIKIAVCSLLDNDLSTAEVNGRSIIDSEPKLIKLTALELRQIITPLLDKIADVIESITMMIPDSIAESISSNGFYLAGGTALMPGIDKYLEKKLYFKCNLLPNPNNANVEGGARFFYNKDQLNKMLNLPNLT